MNDRRLPARRRAAGFTLLELLVVMVIIGLLAGIVAPRYFSQVGKSKVTNAKGQIKLFADALQAFATDTGHFPTTEQGLASLVTRPQNEAAWRGPYLTKGVPADPWGNAYVYKSPGEHGDFDLVSYGKDGQPGGTDDNADITNW